jgi:hypothetical protein
VRENLSNLIKTEEKYNTESSILEYLSSQKNRDGLIPLEYALEKDNIFGILYALIYTKVDPSQ